MCGVIDLLQKAETPEQRARRIVMSIPKAKDELYAMKVDWDTLEAADVYSTKMVPFVTKKVRSDTLLEV